MLHLRVAQRHGADVGHRAKRGEEIFRHDGGKLGMPDVSVKVNYRMVSIRGIWWTLAAAKARSMMRRFCMLGVSRQSGWPAASDQEMLSRPAMLSCSETNRQ